MEVPWVLAWKWESWLHGHVLAWDLSSWWLCLHEKAFGLGHFTWFLLFLGCIFAWCLYLAFWSLHGKCLAESCMFHCFFIRLRLVMLAWKCLCISFVLAWRKSWLHVFAFTFYRIAQFNFIVLIYSTYFSFLHVGLVIYFPSLFAFTW